MRALVLLQQPTVRPAGRRTQVARRVGGSGARTRGPLSGRVHASPAQPSPEEFQAMMNDPAMAAQLEEAMKDPRVQVSSFE